MPNSFKDNMIDQLSSDISSIAGNDDSTELNDISNAFKKTLNDALIAYNSRTFDNDGYIKRMEGLDLGTDKDKDIVKNILNNIRSEYINTESGNQNELLMRRDIYNICTQMPEMHDAINVVRDAIIECNVSTGEVSRTVTFENHDDDEGLLSHVYDIEKKYDLLKSIKNFIVPKTIMDGEKYIHIMPYAKLFAEIEALHHLKDRSPMNNINKSSASTSAFYESVPNEVKESFCESVSLYSEDNLKILTESVSDPSVKNDTIDTYNIDQSKNIIKTDSLIESDLSNILKNINVYNGSSILYSEYGYEGMKELVFKEYANYNKDKHEGLNHFEEAQMDYSRVNQGMFGSIDQDSIDYSHYSDIKGCYVKYLDGLRMIPIRIDRKVIGYYYVTTTVDPQINGSNPNGLVDLSYQNYTRDKTMVASLSELIIQSFNKGMLKKNIQLKQEIAEVIMAHKFSEGKLSFVYIPENEVCRIIINEDEDGKGHSMIEPTLFPARMYLMLTLYNMLYTLNNNTTRVHYLKSSGLNKDYASFIQRAMRKFQSRRITIDDIYSYTGVLNKVGGMGEMVLPAGRNDFKALETDTIEAVPNPINIEFLEQQRRAAITGTGVPHLLVINGLDEVQFAKTMELENARFISTVGSYKIDMNAGITKLYQMLLKCNTDLDDHIITSFRFQFNSVKQQELVITSDMIQNFNTMVELICSLCYKKEDLEDKNGNPTPKKMFLIKELARKYLPQLDIDGIEDIMKTVDEKAGSVEAEEKAIKSKITDEDINQLNDET